MQPITDSPNIIKWSSSSHQLDNINQLFHTILPGMKVGDVEKIGVGHFYCYYYYYYYRSFENNRIFDYILVPRGFFILPAVPCRAMANLPYSAVYKHRVLRHNLKKPSNRTAIVISHYFTYCSRNL